ncbi:hypothetical protein NLG97_g10261 [Lecanicillium saksenae]|uniref:Uncharacterized protein n=1 Tax=Lecanicillium saksenae TaxID=468837 RepID=A0ACC1QF05_9HYPO|nr:hypothetical protein NLG97_g10261 [Lecanicillium saksenae]
MTPPSPPDFSLPVDFSRSPSAHGAGTNTGRPAKWTVSHKRQLARLYVYTTLPINKIIDVVHHKSPRPAPGTDSASKNLNQLLDKEPRWLHPKSHEDMGRRVEQLALSPSRMSSRSSDDSFSRASSDPPGSCFLPANFESELNLSPTMLDVPPHSRGPWSASAPATPASYGSGHQVWSPGQVSQPPQAPAQSPQKDEEKDKELFAPFLRRATVASASTTASSSSLKAVLSEYSTAYRGVVKGLMRRFTGFSPLSSHMSPISESNSAVMDWLEDDYAPPAFLGAPSRLPGDFLHIDQWCQCSSMQGTAFQCCLEPDVGQPLQESNAHLPWVTCSGLTQDGHRILGGRIVDSDWSEMDSFGNTLLHFVAARGDAHLLYRVAGHQNALEFLHVANTARQTFLHVMSQNNMQNVELMNCLLPALKRNNFDIYAQDDYGRNFFHILKAKNVNQTFLNGILDPNDIARWNTRDAFGMRLVSPAIEDTNTSTTPWDSASPLEPGFEPETSPVTKERMLISFIWASISNTPAAEYSQGRNGIHCLAAANLNMARGQTDLDVPANNPRASAAGESSAPRGRARTSSANRTEADSSVSNFKFRIQLLRELLAAGVNPNSYDTNGNTPLMAFAAQLPEDGDYKTGPEILKLLINSGVNINARNRAGETALQIAVRCGRKLAARTLFAEGANVHARDSKGRSMLEVADEKLMAASELKPPREYAHWEACRAWLSGQENGAIQSPTVLTEWRHQ